MPTQSFRKAYREQRIPRHYSGLLHALLTLGILSSVAGVHLLRLHSVSASEWLVIPAVLLLGNLFEYWFHRITLHRPFWLTRELFRIHTNDHHQFFTEQSMEYETLRDFHTVLFPFWAPLAAVVLFWLLRRFLIEPFLSPNAGSLFVASASLYFLMYEAFHLFHHLPGASSRRIPVLSRCRKIHSVHHAPNAMTRFCFNVTFPISDWIFRTLR